MQCFRSSRILQPLQHFCEEKMRFVFGSPRPHPSPAGLPGSVKSVGTPASSAIGAWEGAEPETPPQLSTGGGLCALGVVFRTHNSPSCRLQLRALSDFNLHDINTFPREGTSNGDTSLSVLVPLKKHSMEHSLTVLKVRGSVFMPLLFTLLLSLPSLIKKGI